MSREGHSYYKEVPPDRFMVEAHEIGEIAVRLLRCGPVATVAGLPYVDTHKKLSLALAMVASISGIDGGDLHGYYTRDPDELRKEAPYIVERAWDKLESEGRVRDVMQRLRVTLDATSEIS